MKNKAKQTSKNERGITLIALIVCIIVLILLSAVVLRGITGKESIITFTDEEVSNYNAEQYKEEIQTLTENIIMQYELEGKSINIKKLSEEVVEQTTWIKTAVPNTDKNVNNEDIVITTTNGFMYQVYYNESYGQTYVEYIGREDGKTVPNIVTTYEKGGTTIEVAASSEVALIELIYRDEVIDSNTGNTGVFNIDKTGWYIIKVTTTEGKIRYAWERVSSMVVGPKIEVKASGEGRNGWYSNNNNPVKAEITAEGEKVKGIYYTEGSWKDAKYIEGNRVETEVITRAGRTTIYAYSIDINGNESEIVRKEINYDNLPPEIGKIEVEGKKRRQWMVYRRESNSKIRKCSR